MINFANVKEWQIPYNGNLVDVLQVKDSNNTRVIWKKDPRPVSSNYFWMYNHKDTPITLYLEKYPSTAPTVNLYYSLDHTSWTLWGQSGLGSSRATLILPAKTVYYVRTTDRFTNTSGDANTIWAADTNSPGLEIGGSLTGISGPSLDNLNFYDPQAYHFTELFSQNKELVYANNLKMPLYYNTIGSLSNEYDLSYAYTNMFSYCSNLVLPPESITQECWATETSSGTRYINYSIKGSDYQYYRMFSGCTSLIKTPIIKAVKPRYGINTWDPEMGRTYTASKSKLCGNYAFSRMFENCSSLTDIYFSSAMIRSGFSDTFYYSRVNWQANFTYATSTNISQNMFNNVANNGTVHLSSDLSSSNFASGVDGIPSGWTVVEQ